MRLVYGYKRERKKHDNNLLRSKGLVKSKDKRDEQGKAKWMKSSRSSINNKRIVTSHANWSDAVQFLITPVFDFIAFSKFDDLMNKNDEIRNIHGWN